MPRYTDEEVPQFPLLPAGTFRFKIDPDNGLMHDKTKSGTARACIVLQARVVEPQAHANLKARNMFVLGTDRDPNGVLPETKSSSVAWRRWRELRQACGVPGLGSTEEEAVAMSGKEFLADISQRTYRVDRNDPESELRKVNDFGRFYKLGTAEPRVFDMASASVGGPAMSGPGTATPAFARRAAMNDDE